MGLAILALGGFIAASLLRPAADASLVAGSLEPSRSAAVDHAATDTPRTPDPTATQAPTLSPTPIPTPAGPPNEIDPEGWATVTVGELNVRDEPGLESRSGSRLVRGAVGHVVEGPVEADGYLWYRIVSLGGTRGWAAAGTEASPFLRTLSQDDVLVHCDTVTTAAWSDPDGDVRAIDPIRIGDVAVPAQAFDDFELGVLNLLYGTGGEACITAIADVAGTPIVYADMLGIACGRAAHVADRETIALYPAAGQDVIAEYQVKRETIVHGVLSSAVDTSPTGQNLRGILEIATFDEGARRCVHARSTEGPEGVDRFQQVDGHQCLVVEEWTPNSVRLATPSSDPQRVALIPLGGVNEAVPIGSPAGLYLVAYDFYPALDPGLSVGVGTATC
jgi:hypothetical protein